MNFEYFRPESNTQAATLLEMPGSIASYGLSPAIDRTSTARIVDLQSCGSSAIRIEAGKLVTGACTTLQSMLESDLLPKSLADVIRLEDRQNLRNMRSIADVILPGDGKSPLLTTLMSLDAQVTLYPSNTVTLGDYVANGRQGLIIDVSIPLDVQFAFHSLRRTPQDVGIVIAAMAKWKTGRVRLALGGTGITPTLVVDGIGSDGIEKAASSAYGQAADPKASAEYRSAMARQLTLRCAESLADLAG